MTHTFLTHNRNDIRDGRPCFSPDGKTVLFMRTQNGVTSLYTVPTAGGEATEFFAFDPSLKLQATRPDWSWATDTIAFTASPQSDGNVGYLYLLNGDKTGLRKVDLASIPGTEPIIMYPSWEADGQHLAVTNYRGNLIERVSLDPSCPQVTPITNPSKIWFGMCSVNPKPETGWLLAGAAQPPSSAGYDQQNNSIWLQSMGGQRVQCTGTTVARAPWWSPDGAHIAFEGTDTAGATTYAIYVQAIGRPNEGITAAPQQVTPYPELLAQHAKWSPTVSNQLVCMATQDIPEGPRNGIVLVDF